MCGPDSAEVDRVDLDAGHQLGFLDRLLDRIDRGLEVDDDAAADAARLGNAEADDVEAVRRSMISPTTAVTFEVPTSRPDQVSFSFAPTQLPSAGPKACATCLLPPSAAAFLAAALHRRCRLLRPSRLAGPHVNAIVEPQIDVIDVGHALAQRARQMRDTTAGAARNWSSPSWITAGSPLRMTDRVVRVGHVHLRQALARSTGFDFRAPRSRAPRDRPRPSSVIVALSFGRAPTGRRRSAGRDRRTAGPY